MPDPDRNTEQAVRESAYFISEREGRPQGRAQDHWIWASIELRNAAGSCRRSVTFGFARRAGGWVCGWTPRVSVVGGEIL
jgi:hypothetical protein